MLFRRERRNPFETRTAEWREVGLGGEIDHSHSQRATGGVLVLLVAIVGVLIVFSQRREIFPGLNTEARIATVVILAVLGWALARVLGRSLAPALFRRLEPGTAGTVGFLLRLLTVLLTVIVALRIAGVQPKTLALGGAFTAVILGLAAQQTLGNFFAGTVLISTRPFRVGDRVRLLGGPIGGPLEGVVGSLGLLHTTLIWGQNRALIPNSVLLQSTIVPLREPERVELKARFDAKITPTDVQGMLERAITVPTRRPPDIVLEEIDRDEVIVRISATPQSPADGAQLAAEVLAAVRVEAGDSG